LIKKALKKADKIIIGIGSANVSDENNPIDFETRKKTIKAVAYKEKFEDKLIKTISLDDFFDDKKWLENLKKQVGKFDLSLGNNDWTNKILKKAGYKVMKVDYFKRSLYEGWRIRKLIKEGKDWQDRVPKYLISNIKDQISPLRQGFEGQAKIHIKNQKYKHIVLGGTFDRFHLGHQAIINKAFSIGKKVTIGLATEKLYRKKFLNKIIEPYPKRKKTLERYINYHFGCGRLKIGAISDIYGPLKTARNVEAIIVSKRTYPNALKINQLREKNKLPLLRIIIIDDVLADDGKIISSKRIRLGEIDREGKVMGYELGVRGKKELNLPENLREELRKPLGKIFKDEKSLLRCIDTSKHTLIIAVGDIIVDALLKVGIDPDVKIIDFRSRRKRTDLCIRTDPYTGHFYKGQSLVNNPGTINLKAAETIREKIKQSLHKKQKSWIVIEGEEDLLALPAILFAPLNSLVLYGHWEHGIIAVEVDEKMKNKIKNIINKFV
jgi:pantetheine-phosphate adenylyltransferase